jgi:hypothetical protein
MDSTLFQLLLGAISLALTAAATTALLRRSDRAAFYLVAAGLAGIVFFITIPGFPPAAGISALLLVLVGIITSQPAAPAASEWAESTATRRPR